VAFEAMEAMRWLDYLKPEGTVVVNEYRIDSSPIRAGHADYPEEVIDRLKIKADTTVLDAAKIAEDTGNPKTMNTVLLGALIKAMELAEIDWEKIIKENVKPQHIEANEKALKAGIDAIK
jgi:indolepyruvate ferredoxin oxidoreductase beta subunit